MQRSFYVKVGTALKGLQPVVRVSSSGRTHVARIEDQCSHYLGLAKRNEMFVLAHRFFDKIEMVSRPVNSFL